MSFPRDRLRRLRETGSLRRLVRETHLAPHQFIAPIFVAEGNNIRHEIPSMIGQYRISLDQLVTEAREIAMLGIPAILIFGVPDQKDEEGSGAWDPNGIVPAAVKAIKKAVPDILVITDVCIDEYTSHGHCGVVKEGRILNDETLPLLQKMALVHAQAGADIVAPSDMMDGRVQAIRQALDTDGFHDIPIMAYAAKYASSFYAPFRDATQAGPMFGDRQSYQMDAANSREAMREIEADIAEGADIVMVKPALPYLDIIYQTRQTVHLPVAAYQVSGEYSMIKAAAQKGWLDEECAMMESLLAIRRAGADLIITYFAKDAARLLQRVV
ncbi:MAG: porphobilinogen synthase [Nitrospiraceae bacterium]|nr:porphobilinogen synthase [Nitrospiraceae bacterium]